MLGSIKISTMDYEEFKKNHDVTWVEMKGQDITGSDLSDLTGITQLPNADGCFFRQLGGEAGLLAEVQAESTALNGMNCVLTSGKVQTTQKATHSHWWLNDDPTTPCKGLQQSDKNLAVWQVYDDVQGPGALERGYQSYAMDPVEKQAPNTVKTDTQLATMTFDRNQLNSCQNITGGDETRPLNVSFFHYIKINV